MHRPALVLKGTATEEGHDSNGELKTHEEEGERQFIEAEEEHDRVDEVEERHEDHNEIVESGSASDEEEFVESPLVLLLFHVLVQKREDAAHECVE